MDQRKREIALKAASLFVKKGYHQSSIRDIAEWCGISIGALYHYINSKEDILSLFREICSSLLVKFTQERLDDLFKMPPAEALNTAIDDLITLIDTTQDFTLFWYQESKNLKADELNKLLQYEGEQVNLLKKILKWGCDEGVFKIKDINLAAHDIIVLCDMWAFRRWALKKDYSLDQFKEEQKRIIAKITNFE